VNAVATTAVDATTFLQPLLELLGSVATALLIWAIRWAIKHYKLNVSLQLRALLEDLASSSIKQGIASVEATPTFQNLHSVEVKDAALRAAATAAVVKFPETLKRLNITPDTANARLTDLLASRYPEVVKKLTAPEVAPADSATVAAAAVTAAQVLTTPPPGPGVGVAGNQGVAR
jgi:hypothetical protein